MKWWNSRQWAEVVERAPLISIDLIVTNSRNEVLLGWRTNNPAQHYWFVPGGVVRKGETLQLAYERVVLDELGISISVNRIDCFFGVFEHHYPDNFSDLDGISTHYVVLAHRMSVDQHLPMLRDCSCLPKMQHSKYAWLPVTELLANPQVHKYTKAYFQNGCEW